MSTEFRINNCNIEEFKKIYSNRDEYKQLIEKMSLKERLTSWKPTNVLETNLQEQIRDKKLKKNKSNGGRPVTSYLISENKDECLVYVSFGGKPRLNTIEEGRLDDYGFFVKAISEGSNLKLFIKTKKEHYKYRNKLSNIFFILLGLIFGILPGLIIIAYLFFIAPRLDRKDIDQYIIPSFIKTFEPKNRI
jgi:hypothetical protein